MQTNKVLGDEKNRHFPEQTFCSQAHMTKH